MFKEFKSLGEGIVNFFLFITLELVWVIFISLSLRALLIPVYSSGIGESLVAGFKTEPYHLILFLLKFACIEELEFRAFPMLIVFASFKFFPYLEKEKDRVIFLALLISSAIFGYMHGDYTNILMQGVSGIFFFVFFLKSGGYNGKIFIPLIATTLLHFSMNLIVVLLAVSS